ncbi:MAG: hypothetical protein ACRDN0_03030 [Trebonia sp.]
MDTYYQITSEHTYLSFAAVGERADTGGRDAERQDGPFDGLTQDEIIAAINAGKVSSTSGKGRREQNWRASTAS